MPEDAPDTLGGFTLTDRIGKGGMGEVWRAERLISAGNVRRRAAVKVIPELTHSA